MEAEFQSHLGDVLPLILDGLSDEVREGQGGRTTRQQAHRTDPKGGGGGTITVGAPPTQQLDNMRACWKGCWLFLCQGGDVGTEVHQLC